MTREDWITMVGMWISGLCFGGALMIVVYRLSGRLILTHPSSDALAAEERVIEYVAAAIYREFENRPRYAQAQMNGVVACECARAAIAAYEKAMRE